MHHRFRCTAASAAVCSVLTPVFASIQHEPGDRSVQVAQATTTPLFMYLVGAWRKASPGEELRYEFRPDGSYVYMALFSTSGIYIHEVGNYRVGDDGVTLVPQKKLYRRNGVDSWDKLKVRTYAWRTYSRDGQRYLDIEMEGARILFVSE